MASRVSIEGLVRDHTKNNEHFNRRWKAFIERFGEHEEYNATDVLRWLGYDLRDRPKEPVSKERRLDTGCFTGVEDRYGMRGIINIVGGDK